MTFQHGSKTLIQFSLQDITERKRAQDDLRIAATAFEAQEGMIITDADLQILRINRACSEITGYAAEEAVGHRPSLFSSGRHDAAFYREMWASITTTGVWKGEIWNRRKNGELYPQWASISAVKDDDGRVTHYVASFMDISQRKSAENEIKHLAFYDPLTRLPNRRLMLDRLRHALIASARNESSGALFFIDIDNFKALNDTLGHDKGDLLLASIARRLSAIVREDDTVARLGGDEFVIMMEGLSLNAIFAASQAKLVGRKVLDAFIEPHDLDGSVYNCSASIGIALFIGQADTVEELLKQADLAMYQAKAAGRGTLRFFDPHMQSAAMARAALEVDLREGLRKNQLLLHYQPQVNDDGRVTGAEALVRWQHPERGMIAPVEFIPLAEETGLILPLGLWVLETACTQLALWSQRPEMAQFTVAVNVSAHQMRQRDFVDQVADVLKRTGANPQRLKLELTESLLVANVEEVIEKMFALKAKGVGFALDDFGTGYSSLSYLKRLPLDQLKIDQSFVRDIHVDANDAVIAKTIVALAESLGLGVIAEGVETSAQRDFLAEAGCHAHQGFFFSRPLPIDAFERFALAS
jgi:diguanylate cyclase (GGDEF)-like protein/PAS domain S-box-containing protein